MVTIEKTNISVNTTINAPIEIVWKRWITPEDIIQWNSPLNDWHTPRAENDFCKGGKFIYRMEAKDGSMGFDFSGVYQKVEPNQYIEYTINDGRKVSIEFTSLEGQTIINEQFESESVHPIEHQRQGWQSILDNLKNMWNYKTSKKIQ